MPKSKKAKLVFELASEELIEYCHLEVVALAKKMAEFRSPKQKPK